MAATIGEKHEARRSQAVQGKLQLAKLCDRLKLEDIEFGDDQTVIGKCAKLHRAFRMGTLKTVTELG